MFLMIQWRKLNSPSFASHHNLQYILTSHADVPLHPLRKVLNIAIIIHTPNAIFTTIDDYG